MRSLFLSLALATLLASCGQSPSTPAPVSSLDTPTQTASNPVQPVPDTPQMALDTFPLPVLLGKISPAKDTHFTLIESKYTSKSGIYLRREAYEAFKRMHAAAAKDGINLIILSATRTFSDQKGIWENKWNGKTLVAGKNLALTVKDPKERALAILTYSSMPTTSRHHWGTDIDLNNLENDYFESGTGKKIYDWLVAHASEYGFCQPYSPKGDPRPEGYNEEKWHWSYMPISSKLLQAYQAQVQYSDINGFLGQETAEMIGVIEKYVGGINPPCRDWQE